MGLLIPGGFAVLILWALLKKGKTSTTIYPPSVIPDDEPVPGKPVVIVSKPKPKPSADVKRVLDKEVKQEAATPYTPPVLTETYGPPAPYKEGDDLHGNKSGKGAYGDAQVVPKEDSPPIKMLNHNLLPYPSKPAVKFALIKDYYQAMDYARQGFHKMVDIAEKVPSIERAAYAARAYFDAAVVRNDTSVANIKKLIEVANLKAEKAIKG